MSTKKKDFKMYCELRNQVEGNRLMGGIQGRNANKRLGLYDDLQLYEMEYPEFWARYQERFTIEDKYPHNQI